GGEIPRPLVQGLVYALRVGHLSTQYLDEHDLSLPRRRVHARHRREWYSPDVTRGARRSRRNRSWNARPGRAGSPCSGAALAPTVGSMAAWRLRGAGTRT